MSLCKHPLLHLHADPATFANGRFCLSYDIVSAIVAQGVTVAPVLLAKCPGHTLTIVCEYPICAPPMKAGALKMVGAPSVWGMFNGNGGDQLPPLTRMGGPFPPQVNSKGWIAMGWPAMGDMNIWRGDYKTYFPKFHIAYPGSIARVVATQANMPWNFAFEMKIDDWVICPCSSEGFLLVGQVTGDYEANWDGTPGLRTDFVHFRQVRWLHVIQSSDPRHGRLNRIGLLTLSRRDLSVEQLQNILNG